MISNGADNDAVKKKAEYRKLSWKVVELEAKVPSTSTLIYLNR